MEAKHENRASTCFSQEESILIIDIVERSMDVGWADEGYAIETLNLQILVVDIVQKTDKVRILNIEI